jgi:hypothetical protein
MTSRRLSEMPSIQSNLAIISSFVMDRPIDSLPEDVDALRALALSALAARGDSAAKWSLGGET